jgi:hypothetical protein
MNLDEVKLTAELISQYNYDSEYPPQVPKSLGVTSFAGGTTRHVFLDKTNNVVYKVAKAPFAKGCNYTEKCIWRHVPSKLKDIFAEVVYLSRNQKVLAMQFVPYAFVGHISVEEFDSLTKFLYQSKLESKLIHDIHEGNVGITHDGICKLIDYGFVNTRKQPQQVGFSNAVKNKLTRFASKIKKDRVIIKLNEQQITQYVDKFSDE